MSKFHYYPVFGVRLHSVAVDTGGAVKWVALVPMEAFTRDGAGAIAMDGMRTVDGVSRSFVLYPFFSNNNDTVPDTGAVSISC